MSGSFATSKPFLLTVFSLGLVYHNRNVCGCLGFCVALSSSGTSKNDEAGPVTGEDGFGQLLYVRMNRCTCISSSDRKSSPVGRVVPSDALSGTPWTATYHRGRSRGRGQFRVGQAGSGWLGQVVVIFCGGTAFVYARLTGWLCMYGN